LFTRVVVLRFGVEATEVNPTARKVEESDVERREEDGLGLRRR